MPRARVVLIYRKLALWLAGKARESLMEPSADQEAIRGSYDYSYAGIKV